MSIVKSRFVWAASLFPLVAFLLAPLQGASADGWPQNPHAAYSVMQEPGCGEPCHGNPPGDPHPDYLRGYYGCYHCHTLTVDPDDRILPWGYHQDGFVQ